MPYLGFGSISGIIHVIARLPHFFKVLAVMVVVVSVSS